MPISCAARLPRQILNLSINLSINRSIYIYLYIYLFICIYTLRCSTSHTDSASPAASRIRLRFFLESKASSSNVAYWIEHTHSEKGVLKRCPVWLSDSTRVSNNQTDDTLRAAQSWSWRRRPRQWPNKYGLGGRVMGWVLAFTRYCHCQYCIVYAIRRGIRGGIVYCAGKPDMYRVRGFTRMCINACMYACMYVYVWPQPPLKGALQLLSNRSKYIRFAQVPKQNSVSSSWQRFIRDLPMNPEQFGGSKRLTCRNWNVFYAMSHSIKVKVMRSH